MGTGRGGVRSGLDEVAGAWRVSAGRSGIHVDRRQPGVDAGAAMVVDPMSVVGKEHTLVEVEAEERDAT